MEHVDVAIVGAGISGIGMAYHLSTKCPDRSFTILEARNVSGGTWDLFRYPGIRSDSDMHTLGFAFHPWTDAKAIADGPAILRYLRETAKTYDLDRHIRFDHRVDRAQWSTENARWTVATRTSGGEPIELTCNFLCMCSGYYDYDEAHMPEFAGADDFAGQIVHPQFWPEDLDYADKRVVVIGSGATAVTLVPELAKQAGQVTMLQRSPSYIVARPAQDRVANWLRGVLPGKWAYGLTRWKNVLMGMVFFRLARRRPGKVKDKLIGLVREHLGADYDVKTHFTPRYNPWDQRLCLVPDGDLFDSIKAGRATVETGMIDHFEEDGILLTSGKQLPADIVITATGLKLKLLGDVRFTVDGESIDLAGRLHYKGMMYDAVPNMASVFGYTNASWTLKADLTAMYVCRLLNAMKKRGMRQATPDNDDPSMPTEPFLDFSSGYIQRSIDLLPHQGAKKPWRLNQNYALDIIALKFGSIDEQMIFSNSEPQHERLETQTS